MNDNYSHYELKYKKRWSAKLLKEALKAHQIVVLTGARQVGKSTLLLNEFSSSEWKFLNFDDYDTLDRAKEDPDSLLINETNIIIDEVQKESRVLESIKLAVDKNPGKHRFILSGSSNLLLMKNVSESLAGRAIYFILNPMTYGELNNFRYSNMLKILFENKIPEEKGIINKFPESSNLMLKGFMPALIKKKNSDSILQWWDGFVTTYLERDLRQLSQVDSLPNFRRLMIALALRCGNILNQTSIANEIGLSQPTVFRYINLLETTCLMEGIFPYSINRTKRLVKSPKIMWLDPGLVSFLSGHFDLKSLLYSRELGGIFESLIYLHLKTLCQLIVPKPRIYYWRATTGREVDFVIEWGKKLLAIEVKYSQKVQYADIKNLRLFLDEYPETIMGIVLYNGNELLRLNDKIIAMPWFLLGGVSVGN